MQGRPSVILEITPPKHIENSPHATQQLFSVLQQLISTNEVMPLEINATREEGIRYLIRVHPGDTDTLQRQLAAYLPEARFRVIELSIEQNDITSQHTDVFEIKQARHYAYPLQPHEDLEQGDPANYMAGAMTKLKPGEKITMQVVLAPHFSHWTNKLYNKIHSRGYATIDHKVRHFIMSRPIWVWIITAAYALFTNDLKATLYLLVVLLVVSLFIRQEEPELTVAQQEMFADILAKLGQPLFRADIRVHISAESSHRLYELSSGIASSLAPLNSSGAQSLYISHSYPARIDQFKFKHRMPSIFVFNSNVLAASELASIYHFPYGDIKTEGMVRSHSRTLPAPLAIKNGAFDIGLANNHHHGETTPIGLTVAERERHVFVVGGTGNGKTTLLEYALVQDIRNGKGVAVVDPHGDMAFKLLKYIPESRINDVVYFNPDDLSHPIGLNMLELPPDLTGDELLRAKDLVTESVISVFRKIFSEDDSGGHRIEYVLRNAIHTALTVEDSTLFTIYDLLNDPDYRKKVVSTLKDKNLVNFWKHEMGKAGGMQQVKMMAGITSKIGRFLFSASAKRILEQPKSTIDFDEILNGKILICNFSKGLIGDDTSELFGIAILAKLQLAALRRARIPQIERKPFYLYVDEFQNFATDSFVQMLSEARKYKLFLTMAEQSTSQQDDQKMVDTIFANVGTLICFRSGSPADEKYFLPRLSPVSEGEIAALPSYNFYMRIAAVESQEAFSGETIVLKDDGDEETRERVIAASQKNYAKEYVELKEEVTNPPKKSTSTKTKATGSKAAKKQKPTANASVKNVQAKPLLPRKSKVS